MRIILPNNLTLRKYTYGPVFFFAGPVKGGDDWQAKACDCMRVYLSEFYAVLPCRYPKQHPLRQYEVVDKEDHFERQALWERHYLELAARRGCIIFWLPCESKIDSRDDAGPYARDTYGELGEWRGRMMVDDKLKVVVGAEEDFPGLRTIKCNFDAALGGNFTIYSSMEDTVKAALAMIFR